MKNLILLSAFLCICFVSVAQTKSSRVLGNTQDKGWVSFALGMAIPAGDYGSSSFGNSNAGLAKLGVAANLDYTVPFHPNIGVIFSVNGFINQANEDAVKGLFQLFGASPSVSMTSWKAGSLLAGFYARSNAVDSKPSFYGKVQFGYALTQSPEMSIRLDDPFSGDYSSSHQSSGTTGAFVINGGAGILIPLPNGPSLQFGVNYISMKSDFKNIEVKSEEKNGSAPVHTETITTDFPMTLSNIIIHVGLAWNLH